MIPSVSVGTRTALLLVTSVSAALFGWAAWVLPSQPGTLLGLLAALLASAHAATLPVALLWPQQLRRAWRMLSWLSLCVGGLFASAIGWAGLELVRRFGSLGEGVAALLGAIGGLLLLATWPLAAWGLCATRKAHDAD